MGDKNSYSSPEACNYLGMSKKTLKKLVDEKKIAFYLAGNRKRFAKEELDRYMLNKGKATESPAGQPPEGEPTFKQKVEEKELNIRDTKADIELVKLTKELPETYQAILDEAMDGVETQRQANEDEANRLQEWADKLQAREVRVTELESRVEGIEEQGESLVSREEAVSKREADVEKRAKAFKDLEEREQALKSSKGSLDIEVERIYRASDRRYNELKSFVLQRVGGKTKRQIEEFIDGLR